MFFIALMKNLTYEKQINYFELSDNYIRHRQSFLIDLFWDQKLKRIFIRNKYFVNSIILYLIIKCYFNLELNSNYLYYNPYNINSVRSIFNNVI